MTQQTIFLTDGRTFIGPYGEDEPFAIHRGTRMLRERYEARDVYAVTAETREQARGIWERMPAAKRKAIR